ncbi:MAG TPA: hypothetical protein VGG85_02525 [Terracidiphilus sp.]|jgi:hypothetical protein
MAKRLDWEKNNKERLIERRGAEGVDSDHSGGVGPTGRWVDEPFWLAPPNRSPGDLWHRISQRAPGLMHIRDAELARLLDRLHSRAHLGARLLGCSNVELIVLSAVLPLLVKSLKFASSGSGCLSGDEIDQLLRWRRIDSNRMSELMSDIRLFDLIALDCEYLQTASEAELSECRNYLDFISAVAFEFQHAQRKMSVKSVPHRGNPKPTR